jgi:heterodisulfide reductase subunit B
MNYAYYPGCSLQESAAEYDISTRAVLEGLGVGVREIPDWTCCGASAVEAVDRELSLALPARNLALSEKHYGDTPVLVPCSACYLNLLKVQEKVGESRQTAEEVNTLLDPQGLIYSGRNRVVHLLEVFGGPMLGEISAKVVNPLTGLKVAPYYGCQILRPYHTFDDPERPSTMAAVLEAAGAEVWDWDMGNKCCGASLIMTHKKAAEQAVARIWEAAMGADVIATVCPMCQMNLESCRPSRKGGVEGPAVVYLPQLLGLAMGLPREVVQLERNMVMTDTVRMLSDRPRNRSGPGSDSGEVKTL